MVLLNLNGMMKSGNKPRSPMKILNNILLLSFLYFNTCIAQNYKKPSSGAGIAFQNNINKNQSRSSAIRPNNIQIKLIRRETLGSYTTTQSSYNHCGVLLSYPVVVTTYCDHFSNGTWRTWQTITRK